MLDSKLLKENPGFIEDMLRKRKLDFPLDQVVALDKRRRELIADIEEYKHKRNILAHSISTSKKAKKEVTSEIEAMKVIGDKIFALEQEKIKVDASFRGLMMRLPNLLDDSVPIGNDENDNVVIKYNGVVKKHDFPIADHIDLANNLDLIDIARAAKISGARFYFLKNDLVRLNQALIHFALDFLQKKGYVLLQPPYMIRKEAIEGAAILEDLDQVIYKIDSEDLYMIGTSEHAMASMFMDEILEGSKLPFRFGGISLCFRKEAGAHGKDMKGIFRVHQFEKVEQFIYCSPENSKEEHESMLAVSEEFYEQIGIPNRVVLLCSADLGKISAKTYDIEAWLPGQNAYREIVSCSNCTDYQARRLRIRFRNKANEETRFVHTLNSTLVATERTMVAIIENCQTAKQTIEVPMVLQKYMGDIKEIRVQK
ncbi:MAG TPA: serine--tRNA ligase [Candidatus Nitrosopolaris sp.]